MGAWERKFLDEFGGNGLITEPCSSQDSLAFIDAGQDASPWSLAEWTEKLFAATGKMRSGKAAGQDEVPPEALRYGGWPCAALLAQVASSVAVEGVPPMWAGGVMTPVPKKPVQPLSLVNSRGVLQGAHRRV